MGFMKVSVLSLKEKNQHIISNCPRVLNLFHVKYYFNNFGILLLEYRIELSCLYIPQSHNFISTVWL